MSRRRARGALLLALVVVAALGLRLYRLGAQSFWLDEADNFALASRSTTAEVVGRTPGYPEPKLHAVLLHFWLALGSTDSHARLLSVLFGVATLPLFYLLFRSLFTPPVGLIAAGLLALNPFHVWYSQEARMYAMYLCFATASTLALWHAARSPRADRWIVYGSTLVLTGLSHATAAMLGVAQGGFVLLQAVRRSRVLPGYLAAASCASVVLAPFVLGTLHGGDGLVPQAEKPLSLGTLPYLLFVQSVGTTFGPSIYDIQRDTTVSVIRPYLKEVLLVGVVFAPPFVVGVLAAWRRHRDAWWLLALMLGVPMAVGLTLDALLPAATINPRHVIVCLIGYVGFVALGVASLGRVGGGVALAGIGLVSTLSLGNHYWNPRYAKEDSRGAATVLRALEGTRSIGLVLSYPWPIEHYYRGSIPLNGPQAIGDLGADGLDERLQSFVGGYDALVLIDLRAWHRDPEGRVEATCDRLFRRVEEHRLHGVRVVRYDVRSDDG